MKIQFRLKSFNSVKRILIILALLFVFLLFKTSSSKQNLNLIKLDIKYNKSLNQKIHISYVHHLDTNGIETKDNFKFFMHFAYEPCRNDVDFTITLNINSDNANNSIFERDAFKNAFYDSNHLNMFKSCQDSQNPKRNTFLIVRENKDGGDLCANVDLVRSESWLKRKDNYMYYFFINSSTRGPFLPNYWLRKW